MNSLKIEPLQVRPTQWQPGMDISKSNLAFLNFEGSVLSNANLSETILLAANLSRSEMSYVNLQGADVTEASFRSAILEFAQLQKAQVNPANTAQLTPEQLAQIAKIEARRK